MGRKIEYLVVHCTATSPLSRVESIQKYWKEKLGWKSPGYHYIIDAKGRITNLLAEDKIANGVKGFNHNSVHVSYIGGIDKMGYPKDTRTQEQRAALLEILRELKYKYPTAKIQGHKDFPNVAKACPSFNAKQEYSHLD